MAAAYRLFLPTTRAQRPLGVRSHKSFTTPPQGGKSSHPTLKLNGRVSAIKPSGLPRIKFVVTYHARLLVFFLQICINMRVRAKGEV